MRGRGAKRASPFCVDFRDVIEELKSEVVNFVNQDDKVVLFGHSLGVHLATEVNQLLAREGIIASQFILSGSPPVSALNKEIFFCNKKDRMDFIEKIGGIQDESRSLFH